MKKMEFRSQGEQPIVGYFSEYEDVVRTSDASRFEDVTMKFVKAIGSCRSVLDAKFTLRTGDSNRTLHLADYGLTAYKGIMDLIIIRVNVLTSTYQTAISTKKQVSNRGITEVFAMLQAIGLSKTTKYIVYRIGDQYFSGLDSSGKPLLGDVSQAFTVGTKVMRYVVEGVLADKNLEYEVEDVFSDGKHPQPQVTAKTTTKSSPQEQELHSIAAEMAEIYGAYAGTPFEKWDRRDRERYTALEQRSKEVAAPPSKVKHIEPMKALDPRYQKELDQIIQKQNKLLDLYGGTPEETGKYVEADVVVWNSIQHRLEELTGTGAYSSSGGGTATPASGIRRMTLS